MSSPRKILVPTDFSEFSHLAKEEALHLARQNGAELYILHVVEEIYNVSEFYTSFPMNDLTANMQEAAKKEMERFLTPEEESGITVFKEIITGVPFLDIIRYAKEKKIDLLVISTHGRSGLDHLLFGSVAEKVVRKAHCSVFVVKKAGKMFVMP